MEGTVDPETGAFAIDGLASGTEYAVGLAGRSPLPAGWGFTLSPASIRVVDGSSTISFVAVPAPAKATSHFDTGRCTCWPSTSALNFWWRLRNLFSWL